MKVAITGTPLFLGFSSSLFSTQPRYCFTNYALGALYSEIDYGSLRPVHCGLQTVSVSLPPHSSYMLPTICYFMQVHAPPTTCFLQYATCSLVKTAKCFPNYMLPIIFSLLLRAPFYYMPLQSRSYYMLLHALLTTCFLPPSISLTFLFLLLATPIPTH